MLLKIYGERNTGTNYLAELAKRNMRVEVLPGVVPRSDLRVMMTRQLKAVMPEAASRLHERARDRYFEATFAHNLGWKHMKPAPDRMSARALCDVRFLVLVKNPYAWLLSLYARPHNVGGKDTRFEDFLKRRLPVMEKRENIGVDPQPAVEVWNRKAHGYLALKKSATHAMIVRYEDFLVDELGMLRQVASGLAIPLKSSLEGVSHGVKPLDRDRSQKEYATYYLEERWRERLRMSDIRRINMMLDPKLVMRMGYQPIEP